MTEKVEKDAIDYIEEGQKSDLYDIVFRAKLQESFTPAMKCMLKLILATSDEMLKNIGMTDFTNPAAVQAGLRAQGIAAGMTQAVELICEKLAEKPEGE